VLSSDNGRMSQLQRAFREQRVYDHKPAFEGGPPQFKRRAMLCLGKDVMKTAFHRVRRVTPSRAASPAHFA